MSYWIEYTAAAYEFSRFLRNQIGYWRSRKTTIPFIQFYFRFLICLKSEEPNAVVYSSRLPYIAVYATSRRHLSSGWKQIVRLLLKVKNFPVSLEPYNYMFTYRIVVTAGGHYILRHCHSTESHTYILFVYSLIGTNFIHHSSQSMCCMRMSHRLLLLERQKKIDVDGHFLPFPIQQIDAINLNALIFSSNIRLIVIVLLISYFTPSKWNSSYFRKTIVKRMCL